VNTYTHKRENRRGKNDRMKYKLTKLCCFVFLFLCFVFHTDKYLYGFKIDLTNNLTFTKMKLTTYFVYMLSGSVL